MKLSVFEYIDKATADLNAHAAEFNKTTDKLREYFERLFADDERVLSVTQRVKSQASLKEKIIRNKLYTQFKAEELVFGMHDIIGLRIECRFLKDEGMLYDKLCEVFSHDDGDGFFSVENGKNVRLFLSALQPEKQKNGHEIYRIDGEVKSGGKLFRFELQIKSLVNSFWSEIEHKIIYKNKRVLAIDDFISSMLNSINDNLTGIDHQLHTIFKRSMDQSMTERQKQLENMLVSFLNDLFSRIVEKRTGIQLSFKTYCEHLVQYVINVSVLDPAYRPTLKLMTGHYGDENAFPDIVLSGSNPGFDDGAMTEVMQWLRSAAYSDIPFGEEIYLESPLFYQNDLQRAIGEKLLESINADFYCNCFFHAFFALERGDDYEDMHSYIRYYESRLVSYQTDPDVIRALIEQVKLMPIDKFLTESGIAAIRTAAEFSRK